MKKKRKTYKEKINTTDMPDDIHRIIKALENAKYKIIRNTPFLAKYIERIPNAGIYAYNKLNDFVKELAEKSIKNESVIYAAIKRNLLSNVINNNFNDLLSFETEKSLKLNKLQVIKKTTIWEKIKRFINIKFFNVMPDEEIEAINDYLEKRDEVIDKLTDSVTQRVEEIYSIRLDEEFVTKSLLHYLEVIRFEEDFNFDTFKDEVSQELRNLGMTDIMKKIDELNRQKQGFLDRIKVEHRDLNINTVVKKINIEREEIY